MPHCGRSEARTARSRRVAVTPLSEELRCPGVPGPPSAPRPGERSGERALAGRARVAKGGGSESGPPAPPCPGRHRLARPGTGTASLPPRGGSGPVRRRQARGSARPRGPAPDKWGAARAAPRSPGGAGAERGSGGTGGTERGRMRGGRPAALPLLALLALLTARGGAAPLQPGGTPALTKIYPRGSHWAVGKCGLTPAKAPQRVPCRGRLSLKPQLLRPLVFQQILPRASVYLQTKRLVIAAPFSATFSLTL